MSVVFVLAAGCGGGDARRPLVVYSAHARDILSEFERAFEAGHPEVDVRTVYLGSNELFERLRAERTNVQCDVWWGGDATALGLAAAEGLLAPYKPTYAGEDFFHDADWRWSACFVLPMVLGYQPSRIKPEDLPKTFAEIAAPKFKDRLLLREPAASGTMRTFIGALVAREAAGGRGEDAGFALLKGMVANARPYEGKPELLFESLEKGPGDFTIWNLTDLVFQRMKRGYTFLPAPLDEPVPVTYDGIALSTKGASSADARAFYEFVNTPESLARLAEGHARIPVRPGFDRAKLRPEIREFRFTPLVTDPALLREKTAAWMRRFEEETRPGRMKSE